MYITYVCDMFRINTVMSKTNHLIFDKKFFISFHMQKNVFKNIKYWWNRGKNTNWQFILLMTVYTTGISIVSHKQNNSFWIIFCWFHTFSYFKNIDRCYDKRYVVIIVIIIMSFYKALFLRDQLRVLYIGNDKIHYTKK